MGRLFFQDCGLHAVPFAGIDHRAAGLGVGLCHILYLFPVFCDNLHDRDMKLRRKLKVTVVMGWHAHDRPCTVICKDIVRKPDRRFLAA